MLMLASNQSHAEATVDVFSFCVLLGRSVSSPCRLSVAISSHCGLLGTIIQGLIALNTPTYIYERWHGTMLSIAITFFCIPFVSHPQLTNGATNRCSLLCRSHFSQVSCHGSRQYFSLYTSWASSPSSELCGARWSLRMQARFFLTSTMEVTVSLAKPLS